MNEIGMSKHPDVYTVVEHPEITRKYLDLRYAAKTKSEYLDIYLPEEGEGPFPVIVDIHGGGWHYGVKSSRRMHPVIDGLKRGYAVVSLAYTLSGEAQFPVQIHDVKAAVRFLRAHAAEYRLDPGKIGLWGLSAGAHLAALAGTTNGVDVLEDKSMGNESYSSDVQAVVALYAPVNLAVCQVEENRAFGSNTPEGLYLGVDPLEGKEIVEMADPVSYLRGERDNIPPFFMQYGDEDEIVSAKQGVYLKAALERYLPSDQIYFEIVHGAKHADELYRTKENTEKIYGFWNKHLKK